MRNQSIPTCMNHKLSCLVYRLKSKMSVTAFPYSKPVTEVLLMALGTYREKDTEECDAAQLS